MTLRSLLLLVCLVVLPMTGAWAGGFLSVYEDLPLPTQLTEIPGSALAFDSQDGRIVTAEAKGRTSADQIRKFYASTLPQLGWTQDAPLHFHREQEALSLDITDTPGGGAAVKFTISPH